MILVELYGVERYVGPSTRGLRLEIERTILAEYQRSFPATLHRSIEVIFVDQSPSSPDDVVIAKITQESGVHSRTMGTFCKAVRTFLFRYLHKMSESSFSPNVHVVICQGRSCSH